MKLSVRSTYGLRAMLVLAMEYGQGPVMVRKIAERENLPVSYLEQLLAQLRKAGLVSAMRGATGGYALARPPEEVTVLDVFVALEGPLELIDCATVASCTWQPDRCALKGFLDQAAAHLATFFEGMPLSSLAKLQLGTPQP
ncbi:MAG TPA: Rrf2 family transcriptional regulator [Chroococcales cyanobacterium]